jgi:hypothetical protein
MDPASVRLLTQFDYSIGSPIKPSYNTNLVMSTPVAQFEEQTPLPVHSVLHPTSAERDSLVPTNIKSNKRKRGLEDKGAKSNKKRRTNTW